LNDGAEISLGPEAIGYIRECLSYGKTLARYLLEKLDLESGSVTTFLPPDVSEEARTQFKWGGKFKRDPATFVYHTAPDGSRTRMEPVPNTNPWLVSIVEAFLRGAEGRVCIFEDALVRPSDPCFSSLKGRLLIFGDEVYYFLSSEDREGKRIAETVREAANVWPGLIGALTSVAGEAALSDEAREITAAQLRVLAESVEKIVVGAYDGESYLIWSRAAS
jgi:hypothetical protein